MRQHLCKQQSSKQVAALQQSPSSALTEPSVVKPKRTRNSILPTILWALALTLFLPKALNAQPPDETKPSWPTGPFTHKHFIYQINHRGEAALIDITPEAKDTITELTIPTFATYNELDFPVKTVGANSAQLSLPALKKLSIHYKIERIHKDFLQIPNLDSIILDAKRFILCEHSHQNRPYIKEFYHLLDSHPHVPIRLDTTHYTVHQDGNLIYSDSILFYVPPICSKSVLKLPDHIQVIHPHAIPYYSTIRHLILSNHILGLGLKGISGWDDYSITRCNAVNRPTDSVGTHIYYTLVADRSKASLNIRDHSIPRILAYHKSQSPLRFLIPKGHPLPELLNPLLEEHIIGETTRIHFKANTDFKLRACLQNWSTGVYEEWKTFESQDKALTVELQPGHAVLFSLTAQDGSQLHAILYKNDTITVDPFYHTPITEEQNLQIVFRTANHSLVQGHDFILSPDDSALTAWICDTALVSARATPALNTVKLFTKGAFAKAKRLQELILPDGIETIEPQALHGCQNLHLIAALGRIPKFPVNKPVNLPSLRIIYLHAEPDQTTAANIAALLKQATNLEIWIPKQNALKWKTLLNDSKLYERVIPISEDKLTLKSDNRFPIHLIVNGEKHTLSPDNPTLSIPRGALYRMTQEAPHPYKLKSLSCTTDGASIPAHTAAFLFGKRTVTAVYDSVTHPLTHSISGGEARVLIRNTHSNDTIECFPQCQIIDGAEVEVILRPTEQKSMGPAIVNAAFFYNPGSSIKVDRPLHFHHQLRPPQCRISLDPGISTRGVSIKIQDAALREIQPGEFIPKGTEIIISASASDPSKARIAHLCINGSHCIPGADLPVRLILNEDLKISIQMMDEKVRIIRTARAERYTTLRDSRRTILPRESTAEPGSTINLEFDAKGLKNYSRLLLIINDDTATLKPPFTGHRLTCDRDLRIDMITLRDTIAIHALVDPHRATIDLSGSSLRQTDGNYQTLYGDSITVRLTTKREYRLDSLKINGVQHPNPTSLRITQPTTITATLIRRLAQLHYKREPLNGSIIIRNENDTPIDSGTLVEPGALVTVTAIPAQGYHLTELTANGAPISGPHYTLILTDSILISAVFEPLRCIDQGNLCIDWAERIIVTADAMGKDTITIAPEEPLGLNANALTNHGRLRSITLGAHLTTLHPHALYGCSNIRELHLHNPNIKLPKNLFESIPLLHTLHLHFYAPEELKLPHLSPVQKQELLVVVPRGARHAFKAWAQDHAVKLTEAWSQLHFLPYSGHQALTIKVATRERFGSFTKAKEYRTPFTLNIPAGGAVTWQRTDSLNNRAIKLRINGKELTGATLLTPTQDTYIELCGEPLPIEPDDRIQTTISAQSGELISLWPNPFSESLTIQYRGSYPASYSILTPTGHTITAGTLNPGDTAIHTVEWPNGLYLLIIRAAGESSSSSTGSPLILKLIKR